MQTDKTYIYACKPTSTHQHIILLRLCSYITISTCFRTVIYKIPEKNTDTGMNW